MKRPRISNYFKLAALGLFLVFWILEALIEFYWLDSERDVLHLLFYPNLHEIWMRLLLSGLVLAIIFLYRTNIVSRYAVTALRESENKFRSLFNHAEDCIFLMSPENGDLIIHDVNDAGCRMHGYAKEDLTGRSISILDDKDTCRLLPERVRSLMSGKPIRCEAVHVRKDGTRFPVEISARLIKIRNRPYVLAINRDISQRKKSEIEITERMKLAELNADIGLAFTGGDDLQLTLKNCARSFVRHLEVLFVRIWLYNEKDNVLELKASEGLYTHLNGSHSHIPYGKYKIGLIAKERKPHITNSVDGDPQISDQDWVRKEKIVSFAGHPLILHDRLIGVIGMFSRSRMSEITRRALSSAAAEIALGIEQKLTERKLQEAVITDEMTGLLNRRGFFALAEQQLKVAERNKEQMLLLYLDLDGMKAINDELGHKAGDQALIDTAQLLKSALRESDIIARMGGDEFAVLLTTPSDHDAEKVIAGHINAVVRKHNKQSGRRYKLMISTGIARFNPENPCSVEELLSRADMMMYEEKVSHKIVRGSSHAQDSA